MTEDTVRLAKRLAALLPCSRREAEQYIEGGWVRVDGRVVEEPQMRVRDEKIELDPNANLMTLTPVTLLLHKPAGQSAPQQLLKPDSHWSDDPAGLRPLKRHFQQLDSVAPLEDAASGLLVFTQDWRVARKLKEDAGVIEAELMVEVEGEVSTDALPTLLHAHGAPTQVKVSLSSSAGGRSKLRFAVKGVHLGLIAALCERAGLKIASIKRIRLGRVPMLSLPPGQWRYLQPHERF